MWLILLYLINPFVNAIPLPDGAIELIVNDTLVDGTKLHMENTDAITFDSEEQIEKVVNFPNLKYVHLFNLKLKVLPTFENVPKLTEINAIGNGITTVRSNSFSHLPVRRVNLASNQIKDIENGSFGASVDVVHLSCNQLTELNPEWFKNIPGVQILHLKSNKITSIPDYLLKDFLTLTSLDLSHNQIATIGNEALAGPRHLEYLDLSFNMITELKISMLGNETQHINVLNIAYNRLNFISKSLLDRIELNEVYLWGNPYRCICLDNITKMLKKKAVNVTSNRVPEDPSCIIDVSDQTNTCIETVDGQLFNDYSQGLEELHLSGC